jgi:hypothetical protein
MTSDQPFAKAADELHRQELARMRQLHCIPTLEELQSMTPEEFRREIALMLERLGHTIIDDEP